MAASSWRRVAGAIALLLVAGPAAALEPPLPAPSFHHVVPAYAIQVLELKVK